MSDASDSRLRFLVQHIEGDKEKFIATVRTKIKNHVGAKRTRDCLTIITRRDQSSTTWSVSDGVPYAQRFIAYLRRTPYKESGRSYEVDSVLTGEVMTIVTQELSDVILSHQAVISDIALTEILLQDATREQFMATILKGRSAHVLGAKGKAMLAAALLHGVQEKLQHFGGSVASHLGEKTAQMIATAAKSTAVSSAVTTATKFVSSASGKIILTKLSIVISKSLAPLIAKLLAMPVIQVALKKIIIATVIGTIIKLLAAKLGISVTAALWIVLIPILLAFIAKDIWSFPEKLGVALSDAVCTALVDSYTKTVSDIVMGLLASFTSSQVIHEIGTSLASDPEVGVELDRLIAIVAEAGAA